MPPQPRTTSLTAWTVLIIAVIHVCKCAIVKTHDLKTSQVQSCGQSSVFPNHRQPRLMRDVWQEDPEVEEVKGRILRGQEAAKGAWPWQVSIQLELRDVGSVGHWCGGVLIDSQWILTAAHCIANPTFPSFGGASWTVILSEHNRDFLGNDGEIVLPIRDIFIHPDFEEYQNDVALLKLPLDRRLSSKLSPVCLPITSETREESFLGIRCFATGWGQDVLGGDLQSHLHQVELTVVRNEICKVMYGAKYNISIHPHHLCAGPRSQDGRGTCVGDSGGPIHCNLRDGRWYLAGITSFGSGCAKPGYPDVFARVTSYLDWIGDIISRKSISVPK